MLSGALSGIATGTLLGLLGGGGSIIAVPILVYGCGRQEICGIQCRTRSQCSQYSFSRVGRKHFEITERADVGGNLRKRIPLINSKSVLDGSGLKFLMDVLGGTTAWKNAGYEVQQKEAATA